MQTLPSHAPSLSSSKAGFELARGLRQTANPLPNHVKPQATPESRSHSSSWALTSAQKKEPKLLMLASVSRPAMSDSHALKERVQMSDCVF